MNTDCNNNGPKVSKLTRMMKRLFASSKEAAKKITLNYWKKQTLYLGEDFGLFTQHFKGAMFGLGSGIDTPTTIRL
jgi:metal-dependent amidase/aminoacylase/carboxypeptidase family protein